MSTRLRLALREFVGFERALRRQIAAFRDHRPDVDIELVAADVPELYRQMVEGEGCSSGDWDLFLCNTDWLPTLMEGGAILALMNAEIDTVYTGEKEVEQALADAARRTDEILSRH